MKWTQTKISGITLHSGKIFVVANKRICLDSDGPEPTNLGTDRGHHLACKSLGYSSPRVDSLPRPAPRGRLWMLWRPHGGQWLPSIMDKKTFPDEDRQGPQMTVDKRVLPWKHSEDLPESWSFVLFFTWRDLIIFGDQKPSYPTLFPNVRDVCLLFILFLLHYWVCCIR